MNEISKQHMDIMDIWKHFFQTDVEFSEGDKHTSKHIWRAGLYMVCQHTTDSAVPNSINDCNIVISNEYM